MNFIHSDTFLPVFSAISSKSSPLPTGMQMIALASQWCLNFFSLQNADRVLDVTCNVTHCVVQKRTSSSTKSTFYSGHQKITVNLGVFSRIKLTHCNQKSNGINISFGQRLHIVTLVLRA